MKEGRAELEKIAKKSVLWKKFRMDSGVLRVARGGSGADAPPLATHPDARPLLAFQCGSLYPDPFSQPHVLGRRDTDHLP